MKKTVMVLAVFLLHGSLSAQLNRVMEYKKMMLGFNIGCNYTNVLMPGDHVAQTYNGAGFRLGLVMSEEINDKNSLSPKAELSFNDSHIIYSSQGKAVSTYEVYPINVDIMFHVNHKLGNSKYKTYLLAGPNIRLPIRNKEAGLYRINPTSYGNNPDLAIDLGFGCEKLQKYYCFAPEFRYSIGLLNVNRDPALDHVYFHNVTLVFNFKG
jgi:hypothetical protein